jgi:hypothetical protein
MNLVEFTSNVILQDWKVNVLPLYTLVPFSQNLFSNFVSCFYLYNELCEELYSIFNILVNHFTFSQTSETLMPGVQVLLYVVHKNNLLVLTNFAFISLACT